MASDETITLEWHYVTPCTACGRDILIEKDPSRGKQPFQGAATVSLKCGSCGHQADYPASAVDNKPK